MRKENKYNEPKGEIGCPYLKDSEVDIIRSLVRSRREAMTPEEKSKEEKIRYYRHIRRKSVEGLRG